MRKTAAVILAAVMAGATLLLGGCGETTAATLEDIAAANPELTKTINGEIKSPRGMSSEVEFSGDSFDITYKFEDPIDDEKEKVLVEAFEANTDSLKEGCEGAIEDLEDQTNITGITCTIHIKNSSGDEIWSHKYPDE